MARCNVNRRRRKKAARKLEQWRDQRVLDLYAEMLSQSWDQFTELNRSIFRSQNALFADSPFFHLGK